ncbi:hypothetical protein ACIGXM_26450 [Kitasatospora sp. NPDC052896]|uniref:hypothetical protein n=1 Tax=Kitasatospora sp. NPDC052896 TaxID=3364061 RepID=UPI0037C96EF1
MDRAPEQNPADWNSTWSLDVSSPVTDAVLEPYRPPKPTTPGAGADFEVVESNLG